MVENKINLDVAEKIKAYLRGETEDMRWAQNYYTKWDRPKVMSFADIVENYTIQQMIEAATPRQKYKGDTIDNNNYHDFSRSVDGIKRDRSVTLYYKKPDGTNIEDVRYNAASEFHGCGNGPYYVMFDRTNAVYAEDD